jgi:hypothetical protein
VKGLKQGDEAFGGLEHGFAAAEGDASVGSIEIGFIAAYFL